MTEHTKGPWAVHRRNLSARTFENGKAIGDRLPWFVGPEADADKTFGASIDPIADKRDYAQVFCSLEVGYRHRSAEEIWANARLIAAAPDLLEALSKICAQAESWHRETGHSDDDPIVKCDGICELIPTMKAAIKRATEEG